MSHWFGYPVATIFDVILMVGIYYDLEKYFNIYGIIPVMLVLITGFLLTIFFAFQGIRRLAEPSRITVDKNGLHGERELGKPIHIEWISIDKAETVRSPFAQSSFKSIKINTKDGNSMVVGAHLKEFKKFKEIVNAHT